MKGLQRFGEYLWEFFVVTVIAAVSAVTVIGFFPVTVGLVGFFGNSFERRRFKDIFTTIAANWKIIIAYTVFQLIILVFPILNIYYFNTHTDNLNKFVLAVSYIALIVGGFYMATAPTIIVNMNVNFRQLLYNGIMLLFGGLWRSIVALACVAGVVAVILYYPYFVVLLLYAEPYVNSKLMKENFYKLKAKALGTSVYELKKKENEDDYLDEFGKIKRDLKDAKSDNTEVDRGENNDDNN